MRLPLRLLLFSLSGLLLAGLAVHAQTGLTQAEAPPVEGNVRIEYAEVLRVEPIQLPDPPPEQTGQCAPMLQIEPARLQDAQTSSDCIPLQSAQQEVGAPLIVYDVDYVLRGVKYRSRLPYDPGNRLQVRLSVTPVLPARKAPQHPPGS